MTEQGGARLKRLFSQLTPQKQSSGFGDCFFFLEPVSQPAFARSLVGWSFVPTEADFFCKHFFCKHFFYEEAVGFV